MKNKFNRRIDELIRVDEVAGSAQDGARLYRAKSHPHIDRPGAALYGGLLLGQAAMAAQAHASDCFGEEMGLHSLRCYFLRRAGPGADIDYCVDTLRKGRTFSINRLSACQNDKSILDFSASFHAGEEGFEHQQRMPPVNPPQEASAVSPMETDLRQAQLEGGARIRFSMPMPAKIDLANSRVFVKDGQRHLYCWMRSLEDVDSSPAAQIGALAYLSDYITMTTVAYGHDPQRRKNLFVVSLDHAMWLYQTPNVHEWHLYEVKSPVSGHGRGLCHGNIHSQDGVLWATFAQEGLLRMESH